MTSCNYRMPRLLVYLVLILPPIALHLSCKPTIPHEPFQSVDVYFPLLAGTEWEYVCEQHKSDSLYISVAGYVQLQGREFAHVKELYVSAGRQRNRLQYLFALSPDGNILSIPFFGTKESELPPSNIDSLLFIMYNVQAKSGESWQIKDDLFGIPDRWNSAPAELVEKLDSMVVLGKTYRDCIHFSFPSPADDLPSSTHSLFAEHEWLAKGTGIIRRVSLGGGVYSLVNVRFPTRSGSGH